MSALSAIALLLVPVLSVVAFLQMSATRAALWIMLGGLLFLPETVSFEIPLAPSLDKHTITVLCVTIGVLLKGRGRIAEARPGTGIDLCFVGLLVGVAATVATNSDSLQYGPTLLPGLGRSDLISDWIRMIVRVGLPFLLGRILFRTSADALSLLAGLTVAGLVYTPFVLVELRLSPQWNKWIYGFYQHSFAQTVREGGYRPMVFMSHGLTLAIFMMASALAAWALAKRRHAVSPAPPRLVAAGLSVLVGLLNSLGALIYAFAAIPMAWFARPKAQVRFAAAIALVIAVYPVSRAQGFFPVEKILDLAAQRSQNRAQSLSVRFDNEDAFLEKARERPWFGWGGWARGHVWNKRGEDVSVLDGGWLEMLQWGIVGLGTHMGLLLIPVLMALRKIDKIPPIDQPLLAGCALVSAFYSLDLLPNGIYNRLPMFFAGALAGLSQSMGTAGRFGLRG